MNAAVVAGLLCGLLLAVAFTDGDRATKGFALLVVFGGLALFGLLSAIVGCTSSTVPPCTGAPDFGDENPCLYQHRMENWVVCPAGDGTEWKQYDSGLVVHYVPVAGKHHVEGEILCESGK